MTITSTADADLARGLRALEAAGGNPRADAHQAVLVLLTPGCFAAGQAGRAIGMLQDAGFQPCFAQLVSFDRERITRMWQDPLDRMAQARRKVVYQLLMSGESLLLLLSAPGDETDPASERLAALKGHSDPRRCPPGALRARLGAANRMINMLHSSATTADTVRELAITLGPDDLGVAWRAVLRSKPFPLLAGMFATGRLWCGNSVTHVCVVLRARLFGSLIAECGNLPAAWRRCRGELEWLARQDVSEPIRVAAGYRTEFRAPALDDATRRAIRAGAVLSATGHARLEALEVLDDLQHAAPVPPERLRSALDRSRLVTGGWEQVVLASAAVTSAVSEPVPPP